ncbi:TetR/AcrR family transcriptional regulator [Microbacterium protaetiae]|uniref:TetR/AcrR family transcriptional regulator n=1 Tax=Microbacterium protaetiae TaxID=2509458 RepID=A0A4P6EDX3_9MICO|nr:TetR/AcrR family transcriptional regulator [Microbacterium protaetiae]QAY60472.1 TetR/AcrR family transcriptional regulator [Microbacterium protaetiae]
MAGRPVNQQRRDELLDAVVAYTVDHGLAALTWRPLAGALGVTPTTLVHRFGSKERMIQAVQRRLRERILDETAASDDGDADPSAMARRIWRRVSDPSREAEFRLFFAVYGQALQTPDVFGDFLDHVIADPLEAFASPAEGERGATLVIAMLRGLLLDLLTTGDRERVEAAAEAYFASQADAPPIEAAKKSGVAQPPRERPHR